MKIYTKTGDRGFTKLGTGDTVPKNHALVEAYGTVDELSTFIGLAISDLPEGNADVAEDLLWVQRKLFAIASMLAFPGQSPAEIGPGDLELLENAIDQLTEVLPPLQEFIVPGGIKPAAQLHVARAVCRRAERMVTGLAQENDSAWETVLSFLNRLSDYLFCAARSVNYRDGVSELLAKPTDQR